MYDDKSRMRICGTRLANEAVNLRRRRYHHRDAAWQAALLALGGIDARQGQVSTCHQDSLAIGRPSSLGRLIKPLYEPERGLDQRDCAAALEVNDYILVGTKTSERRLIERNEIVRHVLIPLLFPLHTCQRYDPPTIW